MPNMFLYLAPWGRRRRKETVKVIQGFICEPNLLENEFIVDQANVCVFCLRVSRKVTVHDRILNIILLFIELLWLIFDRYFAAFQPCKSKFFKSACATSGNYSYRWFIFLPPRKMSLEPKKNTSETLKLALFKHVPLSEVYHPLEETFGLYCCFSRFLRKSSAFLLVNSDYHW